MTTTKKFRKVRLFKVSRELNIAIDSLVEHLEEAGFTDALSGSGINASIVEEDAYLKLLEEFADDKVLADRISEKRAARKETEDEGLPAQEDSEAEEVVSEPAEEVVSEAEPVQTEEATEEEVTSGDVEAEEPEETKAEKEEEPEPEEVVAEVPAEETEGEPEKLDVETDTVAGDEADEPAIIEESAVAVSDDMDASDEETEALEEKASEQPPTDAESKVDASSEEEKASNEDSKVENEESLIAAGRYKLAGTKILGKIDLGTVEESEPGSKRKRRRKRKRSPGDDAKPKAAEKKDSTPKKRGKRRKGPEVDKADVEQSLQETLRELEMGASRVRQRRRRQKRDDRAAERQKEADDRLELATVLSVTEFVSTGELANLMDVPVNEVIGVLFEAGLMVSINQRLDADTISFVTDEFGFDVEFITEFSTTDIEVEEDDPEDLRPRAPVVTVMGHVDHGKTSLLDHIRHADVVSGEAGGITQHIGAHQVTLSSGKSLTFLDTPGHEAFTAMRARGAQVTDLVILVVAADDAVMPQTIEAINHARAAEVPIIVAINKIDKPDANEQRVMQQLGDQNVLVEQWGGKVQCELVSAKTGKGIDELLEKVMIEAEMLSLTANPDRNAVSTVIESRLEKGRGNVATVLVQNGTLRIGDPFIAGIYAGRVRAMFDERDQRIYEVGPATPALVIGLDGQPEVGDSFIVLDDEKEAKDVAAKRQQIHREQAMRQHKHITLDEIGRRLALGDFRELHLIVKGDVGGSVEALSDALLKLSTEEVVVNIIHKGVGAINESDVMLASASNAIIVGFQVRPVLSARQLAEREEIDIRLYSVIYQAIEEVRDALEGLLSPEKLENITGVVEVRETFKVPKLGMIAGCSVMDGKIRRSDKIHLIRDGVVIYDGKLASLRRFKDDVREVTSGYECGMGIENFNDLKVGDQIEAYEIVEKKRKLETTA